MIAGTRGPSLTRSLLRAVTLALGAGTLWGFLSAWVGTKAMDARSGGRASTYEVLAVGTDGTPLVQSYSTDDRGVTEVTFHEPGGRVRDVPGRSGLVGAISLPGEPAERGAAGMPGAWWARIRPFVDDTKPDHVWYFVHDGRADGSGEFVGYDRPSNREIGRLGLAGFREGPVSPAERIPVRGEVALNFNSWSSAPFSVRTTGPWSIHPGTRDIPPHLAFVPSGNDLRVADLAARTMASPFKAPEPIVSVGVPTVWSYYGFGKEPPATPPVLVRTGSAVYRLDRDFKVTGTFTIPAGIEPRSQISWYELEDGRALVECVHGPDLGVGLPVDGRPVTIYRVAADGTVAGSSEITLRNGASLPRTGRAELALGALTIPSPAVLLGIGAFLVATFEPRRSLGPALSTLLSTGWPVIAAIPAVAALLAAGAWWWARRFGLSPRERAAWALLVLLLGVPGLVGFLLHRRWPSRVSCPACGERTACDHDSCTRCGAAFPAPALNGTEIFA
ncbi:hypothetical protein OJF2_10500 [Aquisphaera giovannonii]|uniref:Uncharacterized protein n=1 Tax=Aquisphaera giovannonii TaxID=406548 RepID=A0A5B9VW35_9BACT|nr:transposase [Aquisphaera giovannonii]QEH32573.1 hypothetical protein OJF2_10500 [Aquisphaera giovannonii]